MADRRLMLANALANDGVSPQTKKGLIDSGAMTPAELGMPAPAAPMPAPVAPPARGIGRQMSQAEHDQMQAAQNAAANANYIAWKNSRRR